MDVIPDFLALWPPEGSAPAALADEVNLGTEPIATVLLAKLALLARAATGFQGAATTILILVSRARRQA